MTAPDGLPSVTEASTDEPIEGGTFQLENWTRERVLTLFGTNPNATEEARSDLPQKGRVRVNNPTAYSRRGSAPLTLGSGGSLVQIPLSTGLPVEGLLGVVPEVLGLPPPRRGVLLVVDKEVTFALHQRGVYRQDLLTPGRVRYDLSTGTRLGFEGLNRIEFTGSDERLA